MIKLVLTLLTDSFVRSRENGCVPYVSDRGLSRLFIFDGFEPD